jgi:hypothetical protein
LVSFGIERSSDGAKKIMLRPDSKFGAGPKLDMCFAPFELFLTPKEFRMEQKDKKPNLGPTLNLELGPSLVFFLLLHPNFFGLNFSWH